jgi:hypothetical protein
MLPGFNHNIVHKNIVFHVQTEDGGLKNPVIVTHVFIDGNIIDTKKTSYRDIIKFEKLEEVVAEIMKEQHKEMIKNILEGKYDSHPLVLKELEKKASKPTPRKPGKTLFDIDESKSFDEIILDFLADEFEKKEGKGG